MNVDQLMMRFYFILLIACASFTFGSAQNTQTDTTAWSIDLEQVVVTGQYAPTHTKNAIQAIRVIDKETIAERGVNNLEQLFQQDLNIRINQDMVLGSSISLLGVGGENIKVMIDGIPVIGRLNGNIDLSQINLQNIERVEIIEGPLAVSYGSDALGGVINLISKKSQLQTLELSLQQQFESRGENSSSADLGYRLSDGMLIRFSGGYDQFDGFSNEANRSQLWNPKEQWYGNALLKSNFANDHNISYQLSYFDEDVENLGDVRRPTFNPYAFDGKFLTQRLDHNLSHEGSVFKSFYWQTNLGYNDYERITQDYRVDFDPFADNLLSSDTTSFNTFVLRSVFASKFVDSRFNFQIGIDLERENGSGDRILEEGTENPAESNINETAIFGSLRYESKQKLSLELGLRLSENSRYDPPLIPSLHFKYPINDDVQIRGSYAKGFRSPSLKELFISFIDINHYIIGNTNLAAEQSDNIQVQIHYDKLIRETKFQLSTQLFYNNINDQITLFPFIRGVDGALLPDETGASGQSTYFNIDEAKIRGINFKASISRKSLQGGVGYSRIYQFNPVSDDLDEVDRYTPTSDFNFNLAYQIPKIDTRISLFGRYVDRLINYFPPDEINGNARQGIIDGYSLFDLMLNRSFLKDRLEITLGARNLFDTQNSARSGVTGGAHSSGDSFEISPGRSFVLRSCLILRSKKRR